MPCKTRCFPLSQYNSLHWLFPGSLRFCTHTGLPFISRSPSSVNDSLLGCGMVSILSISSLKSAYAAAHDTGAVSLFQVSKIRLLHSFCNISASIGLILNLSITICTASSVMGAPQEGQKFPSFTKREIANASYPHFEHLTTAK